MFSKYCLLRSKTFCRTPLCYNQQIVRAFVVCAGTARKHSCRVSAIPVCVHERIMLTCLSHPIRVFILTKFIEDSQLEANSRSAIQDIPCLLWN